MVGMRRAPLCPRERASLSPGPSSPWPGAQEELKVEAQLRGAPELWGEGGESGEAGAQRGGAAGKVQPGRGLRRPQV